MGNLIKKYEGKMAVAHRAQNMVIDGIPEYCWFLHGHNISYELHVESIEQNQACGMGIPFGDIKKIVDETIVNKWDHSLLVHKEDRPLMAFVEAQRGEYTAIMAAYSGDTHTFKKASPFRVNIFDFPTSIENLTAFMSDELNKAFSPRARVAKLVLMETPSSGYEITDTTSN